MFSFIYGQICRTISTSWRLCTIYLSSYVCLYIYFFLFIASLIKNLLRRPWQVWLSGLSTGLWTKGSQVQFPVRAHGWVVGHILCVGACEKNLKKVITKMTLIFEEQIILWLMTKFCSKFCQYFIFYNCSDYIQCVLFFCIIIIINFY